MTQDETEYFNERAAIFEYDAGLPREASERLAMQDLEYKRNRERAENELE